MEFAKQTHVGKIRQSNQDQIGSFENQSSQRLFILCDGMGGHNAGDVASEMALYQVGVNFEKTEKMSLDETKAWLEVNIKAASDRVLEKSQEFEDLEGMGTTLVAAIEVDNNWLFANVGDSRGYLLEENRLKQITKDQSYVQELIDQNLITDEEARHHPQRNIVTQSVGVDKDITIEFVEKKADAEQVLLLCSDGLSDMLTDREIESTMNQTYDLDHLAKNLIEQANEAGGHDNVSVVLARLERRDFK